MPATRYLIFSLFYNNTKVHDHYTLRAYILHVIAESWIPSVRNVLHLDTLPKQKRSFDVQQLATVLHHQLKLLSNQPLHQLRVLI